jgi:hypothetical protein
MLSGTNRPQQCYIVERAIRRCAEGAGERPFGKFNRPSGGHSGLSRRRNFLP